MSVVEAHLKNLLCSKNSVWNRNMYLGTELNPNCVLEKN